MDLQCQNNSIYELQQLADSDRHSVLIDGPIGSGKSYLANQYAKVLGISDVSFIVPTVSELRDTIESVTELSTKCVLCIENLDSGVVGASYTLLKFLEEPSAKVYIIVTCRNRYDIPETILSRSTCVSVSMPTESDIQTYASFRDAYKYDVVKLLPVWRGVKTFTDVDYVFSLTSDQRKYFDELKSILNPKESISSLAWKLSHFPDKSDINLNFLMNYFMAIIKNSQVRQHIIQCARDLSTSRISSNAVLSNFLFHYKSIV